MLFLFLFISWRAQQTQMQMIYSERYPAEKHTVYTKDGYILTVYRIPSLKKPSNNPKVILFMHGEMNSMNYSSKYMCKLRSSFFFVYSFVLFFFLMKWKLGSFALYFNSDQDFLKSRDFFSRKKMKKTLTLSPILFRHD